MSSLGQERTAVQDPVLDYVQEIGWEYVSPDEASRLKRGETGFVFRDVFIRQMQKLNSDFMDTILAEQLLKEITRIPATIEGNFTAWEYLKGLKTIFVPDKNREKNIKFIDMENIERNVFQVTDEFSFTNGNNRIRLDIVFLINGVPIIFMETKAAHRVEGIAEALDQVRRYHWKCPELMTMLQVFAVTHIAKYYYGATWSFSERFLFNWKEDAVGNFETLVKTFFDKNRILKVLIDYILFTRQDDELKKVVLRPHQMRAVDKIIARAMSDDKNRGLIWHTQGSGKTYTMIVAAQKIIENPIFDNPTVIMIVDRNELESQLFGNLRAVGIESVEIAGSKRSLKKLLKDDKRGLIISMIHKFDDIPESINTRKNIFIFVDEAHRTIGGKLGSYMMGALPNATIIGFTGTPIDKTQYGTGTFMIFGKDDPPKGYLDRYSIAESIEDGTTVPLHYSMAPNELKVDRELLEKEFLDLKEAQGISDIEILNKVLDKAVKLRNMLKSEDRMEKVAKYVAEHYINYIEPMGYKAFLVAVDREACAIYKKKLDQFLPEEYSEVVYSRGNDDSPEIAKYHLSEDEEKRVRKAFKAPDKLPKILIVTEKLLTGFDAPILYCMYLDKPMRDHVLLQAIARVNRPYEDETGRKKRSGFILDFVGIFDNLEKALAFDSSDIEGVIHDIEVLKEEFAKKMEEAQRYLDIFAGKTRDKAVESVLEYFRDNERRQEYYKFIKDLSSIYDILSPDLFLRRYIENYGLLINMYRIVIGAYDPSMSVGRELPRKTAELVQKHTKSSEILPALDVYEINENTLRMIEESSVSDAEKVVNILAGIQKKVKKEKYISPYLISIGEKAECIANLHRQRQKTTQEALEQLKELIKEINDAKREESEKNMPMKAFVVYWILKNEGFEKAQEMANEVNKVLEKWPHIHTSTEHEREVRKRLYAVIFGEMREGGCVDPIKARDIVEKIISSLKEMHAVEKDKENEEVKVEELVSAVKDVLQGYDIDDNEAIATKIVNEFLNSSTITPLENVLSRSISHLIQSRASYPRHNGQVKMKELMIVESDMTAGKSIKPSNITLDWKKLFESTSEVILTCVGIPRIPWLAILAAIVIVNKIYPLLVIHLTERHAIVVWAIYAAEKPVSEEEILKLINDKIESLDPKNRRRWYKMDQTELIRLLDELNKWKCIDKNEENLWYLREKVKLV